MNTIAAMRTSDYATTDAYLAAMINQSTANLVSDVKAWLNAKYRAQGALSYLNVGKYQRGVITYNVPANFSRGIYFRRNRADLFTQLYLPSISFLCNNTATGNTLTITDSLGQTATYTFDTAAGVPTVIKTDFYSEALWVRASVDNTTLDTATTQINTTCGTCTSIESPTWIAESWDGTNAGKSKDTYGMIATTQVICGEANEMCIFRSSYNFQQAALQRFGFDIMEALAYRTDRANPQTMRKEDALELLPVYENKYETALELLRENSLQAIASVAGQSPCFTVNSLNYSDVMESPRNRSIPYNYGRLY